MSNITNQKILEMREMVPVHLDADELIANALLNCADVPASEQENCFESTVLMYIDQDCSSF